MYSIGVVTRQTGISIATLRKWESRYGFPNPVRDESGWRGYTATDVELLQTVVKRVSSGERVGQVMRSLQTAGKEHCHATKAQPKRETPTLRLAVRRSLESIRRSDYTALKLHLESARRGITLLDTIEDFVAPLTEAVGDAWADGALPIHAGHLYSALLERFLENEAESFHCQGKPSFLLVTPAGEKHVLGLSMLYAVLAERHTPCIRLPSDLPNEEIAAAALAHGIKTVALSASVHYPPRLLRTQVVELRSMLPTRIDLVLGGGGIDRIRHLPPNTHPFLSLRSFIKATFEE